MTDIRDTSGRFKPGKSGNPNGRPRSASAELRKQLSRHGAELVEKAVELALAGDVAALRICLDRIAPPLKAQAAPLSVELPADAGLAGTARAFVDAAASGEIPADTAGQMVTALASLARVQEVDELAARIAALEQSSGTRAAA